jgi:Family of unknown function (DUF6252)
MKKNILLFLSVIALTGCEKNVEFNTPGFQGLINNTLWKASDMSATKGISGSVTIKGTLGAESLDLVLNSTAIGTRALGTITSSSFVSYSLVGASNSFEYTTGITSAPAKEVTLFAGGTGYTTSNLVVTTGGSGTGLKVDIVANTSGVVTDVVVNAPGDGYRAGDLVNITGGAADAKFIVDNVTKSNGEITITAYDGATISGNFKFTAFDSVNNQTAFCREGVFYKVPVN